MVKRNAELDFDDVLLFPEPIRIIPFENIFVALSVSMANWMVLYNEQQKEIFEHFITGCSIGEVYEKEGKQCLRDFKDVLSGICARKLGSTKNVPRCKLLDASKFLNIYLTNSCNLHCAHCFMSAGIKMKNELHREEWEEVISQFNECGGTNVTFTGGEPLMNPDFEQIIRLTHDKGLGVTVLSNGLLWTEEMIDRLSPCIDEVQFSIDGVNEPDNAKVRGSHHFDRVVRTVVQFARNKVRTSVATTFTFENLSSAEDYKHFIDNIRKETGKAVFFKLTKKLLPGREVHYTEEQNRRYYQAISNIEDYVDPHVADVNFIEGHDPNIALRNCGFGGMSIAADGNVYFCNRVLEVQCYGNVRERPLKEFLQMGKQLLKQTSVDSVEPCKDCDLRYVCGGDCRIDHFNFKGRLQGWKGSVRQVDCNEKYKHNLLKRMVDGYSYYYQMNGI